MRQYETKVKQVESEELVKLTCDLCGKEASEYHGWASGCCDVNETTLEVSVSHKTGVAYPETGSGVTKSVDMCPDCFENRLIPWLRSQGATIRYEEWDF